MVEKMKYVSFTGLADSVDRVVEHYLPRYDIQLEYAARQMRTDGGLRPFSGANPYVEALHKAERFLKILNGQIPSQKPFTGDTAVALVEEAYAVYEKRDLQLREMESRREATHQYAEALRPFTSLNLNLRQLDGFHHISHSFGRLPVGNFRQFEKFLYDDSEIIFLRGHSDADYIWGVYFTPMSQRDKINSIFSSLHFERLAVTSFLLDEQLDGNPAEIAAQCRDKLTALDTEIARLTGNALEGVPGGSGELLAACRKVCALHAAYDARKYAAVSEKGDYVFVGWMSERDAAACEREMRGDKLTFFSRFGETGEHPGADQPPTKLKNPPVVRLFEFFTRMYGIPVYGEIDPTPVMAVTYTLLFGLMFGDLGQGLLIALAGFLLYRLKGLALGGIMTVAGLSGAVFGLLYGSVFGFEHVIPALWKHPAGDINGTLIFAVAVGACVVALSIGLSLYNSFRRKHWGEFFFSPNGLAGLCFYGGVLVLAYGALMNGAAVGSLGVGLVCVPLALVAFREVLEKLLAGRKKLVEGGLVMFLFSTVLELVEVLLSYATNTISFVRVGAFAISHAFIMGVVMTLSQNAAGTQNPVVVIVGNLVVIGVEGLLVGIQVLRLDFYEVFSRFYNGGGRAFEPYRAGNFGTGGNR